MPITTLIRRAAALLLLALLVMAALVAVAVLGRARDRVCGLVVHGDVLPGLSGAEALALGARVVSQRVVWQSGRMAFQVAFAFERMRASDRVTLAALQQIFV